MKFLGFDHFKMTIKGKNDPEITQFDLNNSKYFGILSGISDLRRKLSDEKRIWHFFIM